MFSISDSYAGKNIAIMGAKSPIGKILLRQFLMSSNLASRFANLIIIDIKRKNAKKEPNV